MSAALVTFVLVFARVSATLAALPVFSLQGMPRWVTALLALAATALVTTGIPAVDLTPGLATLGVALACELVLGAVQGLGVSAAFAALGVATDIMSSQMGMSFAAMFDPVNRAQETVLGALASWLAGLVFVGANLHGRCLEILARSFDALPPGAAGLPDTALLQAVIDCFALGVQLAGPVVALVWMIHVLVALLARLAPRMNAFFSIGMTATGAAGLAMVLVALPWLLAVHSAHVLAAVDALGAGFRP